MEKKIYECPTMEMISFVATEPLAMGGEDNLSSWGDWDVDPSLLS